MSDKAQWPRAKAIGVARELCDVLAPVTERIVVAGSLRRGRASVGDVEILFIPKTERRQADMFSTEEVDLANLAIESLVRIGALSKRPNSKGAFTWGAKNKLALHVSGMPVDLFATTAENWWVSLVVRTGSVETNLKLTTGAQNLGRSLNAYGSGVTCSGGKLMPANSEEEVFALCGVCYLEPEAR